MLSAWVLCFLPFLASGANILAITTLASPSHHIFHDVYLLELANRGHNVTLLGHDHDKHHHPNYTHIVMEGVYGNLSLDYAKILTYTTWDSIMVLMWKFAEDICQLQHRSEGLKFIAAYPEDFRFDLIIWDIHSGSCLLPLIEKFNRPPVIGINVFINQPDVYGNVYQSYIPFITSSADAGLWGRLWNNFWKLCMELSKYYYYARRQSALAVKFFGRDSIGLRDFERNISLILSNSNPAFNYVEALPPNVIPVGGLHIKPKNKLPYNIEKILNESRAGVILFSLGTNLNLEEIQPDRTEPILKTFAKLNHTIIWKSRVELKNLPPNVHLFDWLPQNDIFYHPNVALLITHRGLLTSHEIFYHGIPVVGVPFYLDQIQNVGNMVAKGIGEKIDFMDITEDALFDTITRVLGNDSYKKNAKRLSKLYRDVPIQPLESAIFWTEYVLRHGNAHHLDLPTRNMNFVQLFNLDLICACLVLLLFLKVIITYTYLILLKISRNVHKSQKYKTI